MGKTGKNPGTGSGLRIVAAFEGAKGLVVLLTGFGLLTLVHRDLHAAGERLVRLLHLNPARHYPRIFLDAIDRVTDWQLWALALSALAYAAARIVEAVGLWYRRRWAEWFGFLTGGMYIPLELYEIHRGSTSVKVSVFAVNLFIVVYLGQALRRTRNDPGR